MDWRGDAGENSVADDDIWPGASEIGMIHHDSWHINEGAPVESVVLAQYAIQEATLPGGDEHVALAPCEFRTAAIIDAQISTNDAVCGDLLLGCEHCRTISHCVVPIILFDNVVVVTVIDVVDTAIHAWRVDEKTLRVTNGAASARPRPYGIRRANVLFRLQSCQPRGASFNQAIFDGEHDDAVTIDVVHDRIADDDIPDPVFPRRSIDDNPSPLRGVVRGDAVDQDVFHPRSFRSGEHNQPGAFGLRLTADIVNHEVLQDEPAQLHLLATHEHAIGIAARGLKSLDHPVLLVEQLDCCVGIAGIDDREGSIAVRPDPDRPLWVARTLWR